MTGAAARGSGVMGDLAGRPVVLHFGSVAREYRALEEGAIVVDRSHRGRVRLIGPRAREMVTGLVTADALALTPGSGAYSAALTPRGKIVADVRLFALDEDVFTDTGARAAAGWLEMVRKYVNPRLARHVDESASTADLGVFGARAGVLVAAVTGVDAEELAALAPYAHREATAVDTAVRVARVPDLGVEGYDLFVPTESAAALWDALVAAGATPAGEQVVQVARIEAGRPEWGLDIDDATIPQEANFDDFAAISYTKGCYVGQETVARVHFRGHVNRHLRGLRFAGTAPPPARTPLVDAQGKVVGDVRSGAISPRLGGVALGLVRRELAPGDAVTAQWEGGSCRMDIAPLPFPR